MNTSTHADPNPRPSTPVSAGENATLFNQRPVQAVKVSYGTSWMHFLLVACLLIAWWFPAKILIGHLLWPKVAPAGPRDATAFVSLAYEGVSAKTNEVSPERFQDHLSALRAAGYTPIGLKDVEGLVRDGKAVPRKAVLVTFDHARKTSYFATHAALRKAGWNAVMFLWTKPIMERDSYALLWPYLRSMIRSGTWELGAQSYEGVQRIQTSSGGLRGNFMTSPRWNETEQRYESLLEFQRRLEADHRTCLDQISDGLGIRPDAYAYPFGDFGQYQHRAVMTRPINLGIVEKNYKLGFIQGNLALNTRHSDPRRLNRLLVQPEWTGKDLVARLDQAWPAESPTLEKDGNPIASSWIVDWGNMEQEKDGALSIFAPPSATGAKIWLAGSDMNRDFYTRVKFRLERGQLGIYLRASPDGESYVYLGLDAGGEVWLRQMARGKERLAIPDNAEDSGVWLRQKQVGDERFTLASSQVPINALTEHTLEVFLRDRLLFAHLDGKQLFRSRSMLRGELKPGMVGLSVWSPYKGMARARLLGMEVREQSPTVAAWNVEKAGESHAFRWIYDNAFRLTDLSPRWMDAGGEGGKLTASLADFDIYRMLARVNHLKLRPQVSVESDAALTRISPTLLAERARREKFDGLLVNMTALRDSTLPAIAAWLRQCAEALGDGARVLVRMPQELETRAQIHSLLAVVPNAKVVVDSSSPVRTDAAGKPGQVVRVESVPSPASDDELPLFYMIPTSGEGVTIESQEAKSARLQQEGLAVFLDGQFDRAIQLWREWLTIEPDNPKAYMLVGDALARKGDLKGAAREYDRSLDIDPGQISLAIRRAQLHSSLGEPERAAESLNLYARLFPGNPEVLLAQARWLNENGRGEEAAEVARKLVDIEPKNVEALTMMLRLSRSDAEYRDVMERLVAAGGEPENHLALGQAVWKYELTSLPGAESLVALVRDIASKTKDPRVAEIFGRMAPRVEPVNETLADGRLSSRWWVEGGVLAPGADGGALFSAGEAYSEGALRLLGSLNLRNVFVEATVGRTSGNFWLYTSRTTEHMARFGFSDAGFLHLQTWRSGRLVAERKMEWKRPDGRFRMRMEANGDGIMGYVDGRPMFGARLLLPPDMGLGWAGLAVHAAEKGRASAEVYGISAGASPMRLGVLAPVATAAEADAQLATVRQDVSQLTALCPAWFTIQPDGRWVSAQTADRRIYDVFARYHRMWMTPLVDCRASAGVISDDLEAKAKEAGVDGFILMFKEWPGDEWVASVRQRMKGSSLRIMVAAVDKTGRARMQPVARGGEFTNGTGDPIDVRIVRRGDLKDAAEVSSPDPVMLGY
ncbi:MAG: tetratricopeptide repeat protein [Lentisphaerae bacterium]|nr:tetratricopeptide repeat protein [Lentisphaerota bacterium]